jgi:hypothetical protein
MIDPRAYRENLLRIQSGKPRLAPFFVSAVQAAAARVECDPRTLQCIAQLTLVSEFTYINPDALLPLAISRGELRDVCGLLYDLARAHPAYPRVVLERYPSLGFPVRSLGDDLRALASLCAARARKGEAVLSLCLSAGGAEAISFHLRQMSLVAANSPGILEELTASLPGIRAALSVDAFSAWLSRGTDLLSSNRVEEGVRFLRVRSRESRRGLGIPSAALDDLSKMLKIYAASLAGKALSVVSLESSSFGASTPYSDGRTMFLPPQIRFFDRHELNERVYTVLAAHQAASVGMGTFGFDLAAIDFQDDLRDRYGTALPRIMENVKKQYGQVARAIRERPSGDIEVVFPSGRSLVVLETEHEKFYYSFPAPDFARELFSLVENCRIQRSLCQRYHGLAEDFLSLDAFLWSRRPTEPEGAREGGAFRVAVECLIQYSLMGRWKCRIGDPGLEKRVTGITEEFGRGVAAAGSVQDSARTCFHLYNRFHDAFPLLSWTDANDIRAVFSDAKKQDLRPEIVRDASPDLVKAAEEARPAPIEQEERGSGVARDVDITDRKVTEAGSRHIRRMVAGGALRLYRYPEFDFRIGGYRHNHCTLYERVLERTDDDFYRQTLIRQRRVYEKTRKRFLAMKPEGVEITRHWPSGDEIHLGDAVDYCIDLLRGASPDDNIYFRKVTRTRDTVAAVLVDSSSSTDGMVGDRRIIDMEKDAIAVLASALQRIGDDFGVFSFFSLGRSKVFFEGVKGFAEPWDARTQGRINSIQPQASNRDGCAIRHAAALLAGQPHATKLLLLLSDGIPADVGYGGASSAETSEYAIEDTRRAILECRMKGIFPYCITIDRSARDYISHLYGDYHYTVIDDVTALPDRLSRLYLNLTR